jgi:protein CpxP
MLRLSRLFIVGLAASFLGLSSSIALAHNDGCGHGKYDAAKIAAWHQKRQTELHGKLKLTSQQEAAWKTYVQGTTPAASERPDWKALSKLTTIERLERIQQLMKQHEERMGEVIAATKAFYSTLTPEQQKTFDKQLAWHGKDKHR